MSRDKQIEPADGDKHVVRKSNEEIGYRVKSGHLSLLSRKMLNVLVWHAQEMRHEEDEEGRWRLPVAKLIKSVKFNSRDYDLLRSALDELQDVRVIRQAKGGGVTSEVMIPSYTLDNVEHDGNEMLKRGEKRRGGELWLWFMLPPELKKQLLDPTQYTRLPIAIMASLKTVPGLALYEICRRYATNPGGVTNRDSWQNWWRLLTGATPDTDSPEYKYAKRDVFKRGVEEVNAVTDITVELMEFKSGKFVRDLQFSVSIKQQARLDMGPPAIDTGLLARVTEFGLTISEAERLVARHSENDITATIELVRERIAHPTLTPVESPAAYFKRALKEGYATVQLSPEKAPAERVTLAAEVSPPITPNPARESAFAAYLALPAAEQQQLADDFAQTLQGPPLAAYRKRGLEHPMTRNAFVGWLMAGTGEVKGTKPGHPPAREEELHPSGANAG